MIDAEQGYPAPRVNADSKPFWEAARNNRLLYKRCVSCGQPHFPPRYLCPACWSDGLEWVESKGQAVVYSYTIMRRAPLPVFAKRVPYVVALVDLDEGPRMMANVVGDDALDIKVGDRVRVCFEDRGDGFKVPQFSRIA